MSDTAKKHRNKMQQIYYMQAKEVMMSYEIMSSMKVTAGNGD